MDEQLPTRAPGAYLLAAHPHWRESRVNRRLLEAARSVPGIDVQDLYGACPDYDIDVAAEQRRVAAAPMLVLLHPIQWYSMPALMKLWLDEVLTHGWAYGHRGTALQGKDLWLLATTGGPETSYHPQGYNRFFFDASCRPTSRPPPCAACASCRRCCCMGPIASPRKRSCATSTS